MKKLITIVLILAMLLPAAAMTEEIAGCWGIWIPKAGTMGYGNLSFVIILNESGRFVWLLSDDNPEECYNDMKTGTWEYIGNRVHITNDSGEKGWLDYKDNMLWIEMGDKDIGLKRLADFEVGQMIYK